MEDAAAPGAGEVAVGGAEGRGGDVGRLGGPLAPVPPDAGEEEEEGAGGGARRGVVGVPPPQEPPRAGVRFVFEPDGEPPTDVAAEGDPERPETYATDYHHGAQGDDGQQAPAATGTQAAASQQQQQRQQPSQWEESQRPAWQRHSDLGPNVDPEPSQLGALGHKLLTSGLK